MTEFSKKELEALLKDTEEHLAETKRLGPGYYGIRERYDYAVEADERYIEKLKRQIADYDLNRFNENQQVVLELLQKAYAKNKWMTPFGAVFSVANENDFAIRAWLTKEEQFKVLAAFADWEMKEVAE